jgi:hypothetical protein
LLKARLVTRPQAQARSQAQANDEDIANREDKADDANEAQVDKATNELQKGLDRALWVGVLNDEPDVVQVLLSARASANCAPQCAHYYSVLHFAAHLGQRSSPRIVQLLAAAGAKWHLGHVMRSPRLTPLGYVSTGETARALHECYSQVVLRTDIETAFSNACTKGNPGVVRYLLEANALPNGRPPCPTPPLALACINMCNEHQVSAARRRCCVVRLLLAAGASAKMKTEGIGFRRVWLSPRALLENAVQNSEPHEKELYEQDQPRYHNLRRVYQGVRQMLLAAEQASGKQVANKQVASK